jgi:integrase
VDNRILPQMVRKEMRYMNVDEVKKLLQVAKEGNERNYALYYLAIVTGMR